MTDDHKRVLWLLACGKTAEAIALRESQNPKHVDGRIIGGWKRRELRRIRERQDRRP